jgi:hypothetical protein
MKKYQVSIQFNMDEDFMNLVPAHRLYINNLINKGIIDHYIVSLESQRSWITFTAEKRKDVEAYLKKSPLYHYWIYDIEQINVYDGQTYRLPTVQLN